MPGTGSARCVRPSRRSSGPWPPTNRLAGGCLRCHSPRPLQRPSSPLRPHAASHQPLRSFYLEEKRASGKQLQYVKEKLAAMQLERAVAAAWPLPAPLPVEWAPMLDDGRRLHHVEVPLPLVWGRAMSTRRSSTS
ncbi:hypothetical protein WJX81_000173 [Elliptochloris bilobata]|uniref:Uncharacterized protein n=1 Tax=Elliptochloris bilobata TaxID=381761 RepID=A0AAW1RMW9_9CHLO